MKATERNEVKRLLRRRAGDKKNALLLEWMDERQDARRNGPEDVPDEVQELCDEFTKLGKQRDRTGYQGSYRTAVSKFADRLYRVEDWEQIDSAYAKLKAAHKKEQASLAKHDKLNAQMAALRERANSLGWTLQYDDPRPYYDYVPDGVRQEIIARVPLANRTVVRDWHVSGELLIKLQNIIEQCRQIDKFVEEDAAITLMGDGVAKDIFKQLVEQLEAL